MSEERSDLRRFNRVDRHDFRDRHRAKLRMCSPDHTHRSHAWHFGEHEFDLLGKALQPRDVDDRVRAAFEEDRVILEAVHIGMKNRTTRTTGLMLDAAAGKFRKTLPERPDRRAAVLSTPSKIGPNDGNERKLTVVK